MQEVCFRLDAGRFVAAQSENIANAVLLELGECLTNFFPIRIDTGQVRNRFDVVIASNERGNFTCFFTLSRTSACAIRYADEVGRQPAQTKQCVIDDVDGGILFRRKNLQRKNPLKNHITTKIAAWR